MLEVEVRPRGPYSLALTARLAYDATRSFLDGVLTCALEDQVVHAWQRTDGTVVIRAENEAGVERLRFVLAVDDDHSEFLRRFARDPLLRGPIRERGGLRPLRFPTVAGALLRALGAGVPAVAFDVGGIAEPVRRFGAGLVAPAGDLDGLADALRRVLDDPAPYRAGAERARAELTWDAAARMHLELYAGLR